MFLDTQYTVLYIIASKSGTTHNPVALNKRFQYCTVHRANYNNAHFNFNLLRILTTTLLNKFSESISFYPIADLLSRIIPYFQGTVLVWGCRASPVRFLLRRADVTSVPLRRLLRTWTLCLSPHGSDQASVVEAPPSQPV
jgi:hypothetical protein